MNDVKASLIKAMQAYFGEDAKRISHTLAVTDYAERLMKSESVGYLIVIAAAVLHDIGMHEAEKKYGSTGGKYQEIEGPPIAREILTKFGFEPNQIDEICEIIGNHHSPGKIDSTNFKVLYDADWLVNLRDEYNICDKEKLTSIIGRVFLTESGKVLASQIYLRSAGLFAQRCDEPLRVQQ
ncbi:HD domain-containing protein [Chloroflexota bacterium]